MFEDLWDGWDGHGVIQNENETVFDCIVYCNCEINKNVYKTIKKQL